MVSESVGGGGGEGNDKEKSECKRDEWMEPGNKPDTITVRSFVSQSQGMRLGAAGGGDTERADFVITPEGLCSDERRLVALTARSAVCVSEWPCRAHEYSVWISNSRGVSEATV